MSTDGRYELLTKKEVIKLERERKHLSTNLSGIKSMKRLAGCDLRGGLEQRGHRGRRGAQAGHPGGCGCGYELRSDGGRLRDSGQRRRAARDSSVHDEDCRLGCRGRADGLGEGVRDRGCGCAAGRGFARVRWRRGRSAADVHEAASARSCFDGRHSAEDENVDLEAVLGGNIRKAPSLRPRTSPRPSRFTRLPAPNASVVSERERGGRESAPRSFCVGLRAAAELKRSATTNALTGRYLLSAQQLQEEEGIEDVY